MYTDNRDFAQETANFEFFVGTVNRVKPAFVVITGDLVNQAGNAAEIAEYRRIASKLDKSIPIYNVPGNHDLGNAPTADSLAAYRKSFGRDYYTFRAAGVTAFVLDSALIYDPSHVPDEERKQEAWLEQELAWAKSAGTRHMIVFLHHPLYLLSPDEGSRYENLPLERRRRYLDLFKEYGVEAVFAGHYHQNHALKYGDTELVVTGAVGKPLAGSRSGFRAVIVRDGGIEHRYYEFGDVPNRIPAE